MILVPFLKINDRISDINFGHRCHIHILSHPWIDWQMTIFLSLVRHDNQGGWMMRQPNYISHDTNKLYHSLKLRVCFKHFCQKGRYSCLQIYVKRPCSYKKIAEFAIIFMPQIATFPSPQNASLVIVLVLIWIILNILVVVWRTFLKFTAISD